MLWRFPEGHGDNLNDYKFTKVAEVLDHFITKEGSISMAFRSTESGRFRLMDRRRQCSSFLETN